MNNDYLWDRTGEPDPKIQELEQVLGTLRYQPRPLALPAQVRVGRQRTFFPRIAIAAAVAAMMLVGGTFWLLQHRQNPSPGLGSAANIPAVEKVRPAIENLATPPKADLVLQSSVVNGTIKDNRSGVRKSLAGNKKLRRLARRGTEFTASDRAKAQAAKQQLLLALRVASAKLSLAQKKAQGGYPVDLIRNQHKVG